MSATDRSLINPIYGTKTTADTIPANVTKTGTIASTGLRISGTGTLFTSNAQIRKGDFVFAQNQVRRVEAIYSDNTIGINRAFAPDLTPGTLFKVIRFFPNIKVGIVNIGGASAKISTMTSDDQDLIQGALVVYDSSNSIGPIAYNPNGSTLVVTNGVAEVSATAGGLPSHVIVDSGSITATLPSGAHTITSSNASSSGSVTAGAKFVTMDTSPTFSGTINGIARLASTSYEFTAETGKTLPAIAYVITTGTINIDKTV